MRGANESSFDLIFSVWCLKQLRPRVLKMLAPTPIFEEDPELPECPKEFDEWAPEAVAAYDRAQEPIDLIYPKPDYVELVKRLVSDDRMERVWRELQKRRRD